MFVAPHGLRIKHLAMCLSAAFALTAARESTSADAAVATPARPKIVDAHRFADAFAMPRATSGVTHNVSSCLDNGAVGTLRQVVGISASGDTVDLGGLPLTCSTISLSMGEITIAQAGLRITGPASRALTITNSQVGRILDHSGVGQLAVVDLVLDNALVYSPGGTAKGGCILSNGDVYLRNAVVSGCHAVAYAGNALGGAVYATGSVRMYFSKVIASAAYNYDDHAAAGGGIYAFNGIVMAHSTISGNFCASVASCRGGGAFLHGGDVGIYYSTIDSNQADFGGGIDWIDASRLFVVKSSTISGNKAIKEGGGIQIVGASAMLPVYLFNSTFAFNSAPAYAGIFSSVSANAISSIIAKNTNTLSGPFADLYIFGQGRTLTGQNNLITASNLGLALTLTGDPKLTPLAYRGGVTRTHGLSLGSPAVDGGIPSVATTKDQRDLLREVPAGEADIGAYERQASDDEIFYGGFD